MIIESCHAASFLRYGRIIEGLDVQPIVDALNQYTPLPEGVGYVPSDPALQNLPAAKAIAVSLFGGLPVQFGWCNGHNSRLNCLEYHRNSEFNLGTEDFILLLAKEDEIINGKLDTARVRAFRVPKGTLVEVYADTLHYAPCHTDAKRGFRVLIALPEGTNQQKPDFTPAAEEDRCLFALNKWLLAHPDSAEARQGAYVGLTVENITV